MRVAVADAFGSALSWCARLQDEGNDVRYYVAPPSHKTVGQDLVPLVGSWQQLLAWAKEGALQKEPTVMLFATTKLEAQADEARRWGLRVIGGGSFPTKLEDDRSFGTQVAEQAGCRIPPFEEFSGVDACIERCKGLNAPVYFKTDSYIHSDATHGADNGAAMAEYLSGLRRKHGIRGTCILQQKIDGVPLSTNRWWNGMNWVGRYLCTYENKKQMNGNVGPSTGCAFNAVWFYQDETPEIATLLGWDNLTDRFRKEQAVPGLYDINAIVDKQGSAWFLEWTARLGFDSEMTSGRLIADLGRHLWDVADGREPEGFSDSLAYAIRLGVPPYPWEYGEKNDKGAADGEYVCGADGLWDGHFIAYNVRGDPEGELCMAGPEGIVGLSLSVGNEISDLHEACVAYAKDELRVAGLGFRTDGAEDIIEASKKLDAAGIDVHPGMFV